MHAWTGKYLRVDLTDNSVAVEEIPPGRLEAYLGGRGLAVRYLIDEIDPQVEPLAPENKLIMANGPLTGTPIPTGARYMVITKSPLTGALTCSNAGGHFPTEMKRAGLDMIIIEGRAAEPVYLYVEDGQAELRSADHLWGRTVPDTDRMLRQATSDSAKTAIIGPAGEKQVRIAAIMNDKHRAAGRAGVGAVMGAKNLKAVVVKGSGKVSLADPDVVKSLSRKIRDEVKATAEAGKLVLRDYGTAYMPPVTSGVGICPTRNFQTGVFEGAERISGQVLTEKYLVRPGACWGCPIACGRITKLDHPRWKGQGEGPEYETLASLGSSCGVDELEAIIKANYLCNELGLDTISMGMTIGCAMELFEHGLLPEEDVGGTLNFGDAEAMVKLTEQTGRREGFGDLLAEGSYRLAQHYGHPEYSITAKKLEFPGYDPRGAKGMGILYATSNIGASHMKGDMIYLEFGYFDFNLDPLSEQHKGRFCKQMQDIYAVVDSAGVCAFVAMRHLMKHDESLELDRMAEAMRGATGVEFDAVGLLEAGERIYNLERSFLIAAGFTRADDNLPPRMLKEPLPEGPAKGQVVDLETMLEAYYQDRGWDSAGVPRPETLARLKLT